MSADKVAVSTVPKWDGKKETFARYILQVEALAVLYNIADARKKPR